MSTRGRTKKISLQRTLTQRGRRRHVLQREGLSDPGRRCRIALSRTRPTRPSSIICSCSCSHSLPGCSSLATSRQMVGLQRVRLDAGSRLLSGHRPLSGPFMLLPTGRRHPRRGHAPAAVSQRPGCGGRGGALGFARRPGRRRLGAQQAVGLGPRKAARALQVWRAVGRGAPTSHAGPLRACPRGRLQPRGRVAKHLSAPIPTAMQVRRIEALLMEGKSFDEARRLASARKA
jgi:hypothetical protein